MGIDEYLAERMYTNVWLNYTHQWPTANYVIYVRGGARTYECVSSGSRHQRLHRGKPNHQ